MFASGQMRTVLIISIILCILKNAEAEEVRFGYTEEEIKLIPKFRKLVEDGVIEKYMLHDSYLVRWIRSTNYDLERAKENFFKHVQWKKELDDSDYLSDAKELDSLFPYKIIQAKDGRPAFLGYTGEWKVWKAELIAKQPYPLARHLMKILEEISLKIIESSYEGHPNVTNGMEIFDMTGYSLGDQGCPSCIMDCLHAVTLWEKQYPRLMGDIVGINTPWIFENFLSLIKHTFGDYYNQIMHFYGVDKADWEGTVIDLLGKNPFTTEKN